MTALSASNKELREHLEHLELKREGAELLGNIRELEKRAHWEGLMANYFSAMESWEPRHVGNHDYDDGESLAKHHHYERPTALTDFMHGSYEPFWSTNGMLRVIQGTSRYLAASNIEGKSLVKGLADYAVYTGFNFEVEHADKDNPAPDDLIKAVKKEIDDFLKRSDFEAWGQGNAFEESRMWGEHLLHVYPGPGGLPRMREIPTLLLEEPSARSHRELEAYLGLPESSWTYGVVTDLLDTSEVFGYVFANDPAGQQYDFAKAEDCIHIKLNTPRKVKRGLTDFYPVFKLMRFLDKTLFNMVVGAAMQASIAYIRSWQTGTGGVGGVTSLGTTGLPKARGLDGKMREDHPPGQIVDTYGAEYHSSPMGSGNAEQLITVFETGVRAVGMFYRMPAYMSSGQSDTQNRSTSDSTEQHFIKSTERIQVVYSHSYREAAWKAVAIAARANRFSKWGLFSRRELEQFVKIHCEPPEVGTRNRADEAAVNNMMIMARVMSRQTWAEREGLDWDIENERIEQEDEKELARQEQQMAMQSYYEQPTGSGQTTEGRMRRRKAKNHGRRRSRRQIEEDCGAGAPGSPGFQPGNTCAKGSAGGSQSYPRSGGDPSPPGRRRLVGYHYSRDDRSQDGIHRSHAGTAAAGKNEKALVGSGIDAIYLYLPGAKAERSVLSVAPVQHRIDLADLNLIDISDESFYEQIWNQLPEKNLENLRRKAMDLGYEGVIHTRRGIAEIYRDIRPEEIQRQAFSRTLEHQGPGNHPSGSPQSVHGGGGGGSRDPHSQVVRDRYERMRRQMRDRYEDDEEGEGETGASQQALQFAPPPEGDHHAEPSASPSETSAEPEAEPEFDAERHLVLSSEMMASAGTQAELTEFNNLRQRITDLRSEQFRLNALAPRARSEIYRLENEYRATITPDHPHYNDGIATSSWLGRPIENIPEEFRDRVTAARAEEEKVQVALSNVSREIIDAHNYERDLRQMIVGRRADLALGEYPYTNEEDPFARYHQFQNYGVRANEELQRFERSRPVGVQDPELQNAEYTLRTHYASELDDRRRLAREHAARAYDKLKMNNNQQTFTQFDNEWRKIQRANAKDKSGRWADWVTPDTPIEFTETPRGEHVTRFDVETDSGTRSFKAYVSPVSDLPTSIEEAMDARGFEKPASFLFADEHGSFSMTGRGDGMKVMRKTSQVFAEAIRQNPSAITFTSDGTGRTKLYDFLTRKASTFFPGYTGVKMSGDSTSSGEFAVVRDDVLDGMSDHFEEHRFEILEHALPEPGQDFTDDPLFWQELEESLFKPGKVDPMWWDKVDQQMEHFGPGNHPGTGTSQAVHGSGGGQVDGESHNLARQIRAQGGFTYHVPSDEFRSSGFAVSPYPDQELVLDADIDDATMAKSIKEHLLQNMQMFRENPDLHFGGWHNNDPKEGDGKFYFDLSIVVDNEEEAAEIATEFKQAGYYDLGNQKTVYVGADAERRNAATEGIYGAAGRLALRRRSRGEDDQASDAGARSRLELGSLGQLTESERFQLAHQLLYAEDYP